MKEKSVLIILVIFFYNNSRCPREKYWAAMIFSEVWFQVKLIKKFF